MVSRRFTVLPDNNLCIEQLNWRHVHLCGSKDSFVSCKISSLSWGPLVRNEVYLVNITVPEHWLRLWRCLRDPVSQDTTRTVTTLTSISVHNYEQITWWLSVAKLLRQKALHTHLSYIFKNVHNGWRYEYTHNMVHVFERGTTLPGHWEAGLAVTIPYRLQLYTVFATFHK